MKQRYGEQTQGNFSLWKVVFTVCFLFSDSLPKHATFHIMETFSLGELHSRGMPPTNSALSIVQFLELTLALEMLCFLTLRNQRFPCLNLSYTPFASRILQPCLQAIRNHLPHFSWLTDLTPTIVFTGKGIFQENHDLVLLQGKEF